MTPREARLSELLRGAGVEPLEPVGPDPSIRGATLDSRRAGDGDLFFAIRGFQVDGERFAPDAVRAGARAVVAATARPSWAGPELAWVRVDETRRAAGLLSREVYARPDESLTLVGVTGTNGKTTVAWLVQSIATAAGLAVGRIGTVGHALGEEEHAAEHTTPEAPELFRLLAEMRDRGVELVAMEVSSHALALHRVEGTRFATAAFLNLGRDHLDFHPDVESYFTAKARLFEGLGPQQCAVLPADDEYGKRLRARIRGRVLTFGRGRDADVRLRGERSGLDGSTATLDTPGGSLEVSTPLLGRFNLDNIAAAAACAVACGLPLESIAAGVRRRRNVPGRMEKVTRGQPFHVIVDFAHTEQALRNLLGWTREVASGAVRVVFGCGGDRDRGKRAAMGRAAAELATRLYVTSDNPRSEDPRRILDEILQGVDEVDGGAERTERTTDRREAITAALGAAEPGDVVVIVGKGHETTQEIAGRLEPFVDRDEAVRALRGLGYDGEERG